MNRQLAAGGKTSPKVNSVEGAAPEGPPPGGATLGLAYNKLGKKLYKNFYYISPEGRVRPDRERVMNEKIFSLQIKNENMRNS